MDIIKDFCIIYVTTPTFDMAKVISKELLNLKLVACCSIIPNISSMFIWENEIKYSNEYLIVIKTKTNLFDKISEIIKNNHEYEVPEIICTKIEKGNKDYLNWIDSIIH